MVGVPAVWEGVVAKVNLGNPVTKNPFSTVLYVHPRSLRSLKIASFCRKLFLDSFVVQRIFYSPSIGISESLTDRH